MIRPGSDLPDYTGENPDDEENVVSLLEENPDSVVVDPHIAVEREIAPEDVAMDDGPGGNNGNNGQSDDEQGSDNPGILNSLFDLLMATGTFTKIDNVMYFTPVHYLEAVLGRVAQNENGTPLEQLRAMYVKYTVRDGYMLASLEGDALISEQTMIIPFDTVYNMKVTLLFYVMNTLCFYAQKGFMYFSFSVNRSRLRDNKNPSAGDNILYPLNIRVNTDNITLSDIMAIYNEIIDRLFEVEAPNRDASGWTWNTSLESGDRIMFVGWQDLHGPNWSTNYLTLKIHAASAPSAPVATAFNDSIRRIVEKVFPQGGLKVVTNTDDFCFMYTFLLGCFFLYKKQCLTHGAVFETPVHVLSAATSQCGPWFKAFAESICRHTGACCLLEEKVRKKYDLREFCNVMQNVENLCLAPCKDADPPDVAVDVYVMDSEHRVYPAFCSNRKTDKRIRMLMISRAQGSHFTLITDEKKVWKCLGGKPFAVCSRCKKAYFTHGLLANHVCLPDDDNDGFHWNEAVASDESDVECGRCWKCRLKFNCEYTYLYHMANCFMKGKPGFRMVRLPESEYLCGKETNPGQRDLPLRYLYFADFECCINEQGDHTFMSGGLYNESTEEYNVFYTLEEFMAKVVAEGSKHKKITVYFHNAMNYDANFILRYVLNKKDHPECDGWSIRVIMKSINRLQKLSFMFQTGKTKHIIEIGDTYHFLTLSLDRICASLKKEAVNENVSVFPRFFKHFAGKYGVPDVQVNEILKKNLFPYKFFDDPSKLETPMEVFRKVFEPAEENLKYFSESVSLEDLARNLPEFSRIVDVFKCRSAKDYHDLYLMCDVLQIADVFSASRLSIWNTHHVDLTDYIGMPSASWDAFLKFNPAMKIPLYRHTIFAEFFAKMTRGGVTSAPLRHAVCDATHSILYLDVNGLYPFVMKKYAYPTGRFGWYHPKAEDNENPKLKLMAEFMRAKRTHRGFCACVDLHYTREVKEKTDQFPFAPDHMLINDQYFDEDGNLYPFLKSWSEANGGEKMKPFRGLVGTLYDKKEYCVHWKLLKWYMKHGLEVTKIHYLVYFNEEKYLEGYVSHNIALRNERKDELGKMVYKLMGNSVYGKTFESPFNHYKYVIARNAVELDGLIQTENVACFSPIDGENTVVKLTGDEVLLDKPTYIGACVTEFAKLHMYKLFYDKISVLFNKVELVYTDTDSFIIRVEHEAGMDGEAVIKHLNSRETLIGKEGGLIKSETGTDLIREVVALRSKVYAYVTNEGHIGKRAKGTTAAAQETQLDWETYKKALFELRAVPTHNMQFLREGFTVKSTDMVKISLSANDGKRKICEDGVHTHAFGYDEN